MLTLANAMFVFNLFRFMFLGDAQSAEMENRKKEKKMYKNGLNFHRSDDVKNVFI